MLKNLRGEAEYRWRLLVLAGAAAIVAAITLIASSAVAGAAGILLTLLLAVLLNPAAHAPPRPELKLVAAKETHPNPSEQITAIFTRASTGDDQEEPDPKSTQGALIKIGQRRPLDIDAVLADAVQRSRNNAPRKGSLAGIARAITPFQAEPTREDYTAFDASLEEYGERLRSWLGEVDDYLTIRSGVLVLEAGLSNNAKVDAEDARVLLRFPASFSPFEELPEVSDPPQPPAFPTRPSPFGRMIQDATSFGSPAPPLLSIAPPKPATLQNVLRSPNYQRDLNGVLEADYNRQTIHHGELTTAGEPLIVVSHEAGTHEVRWAIHAKNLPNPRRGSTRVLHAEDQLVGEPIESLGGLEAVLEDLVLDNDSE